jgi:predicted TIM-barrel fold metal-dependent hydrolase
MRDIPLFDSLTHPTLDGSWLNASVRRNTLRELEAQMAATRVRWALAVGMKGVGGYRIEAYADYIRTSSRKIFPVAYFDFESTDTAARIRKKLDAIARHGYVGIKLHPRISRIDLGNSKLPVVFAEAGERRLVVLLCTYLYGTSCGARPGSYWDIARLLERVPPACKVVLVHGGDVHLLAMREITRGRPNVLLDLSFTLCRYEGSSVDLDIRHLFRSYDRRICVGSDSPQFSLRDLRRRFDELSTGIAREKLLNIGHKNLLTFLGVA